MVGRFIFKIGNIRYSRVLLKESCDPLDNSVLLVYDTFFKKQNTKFIF